MNKGILLALFPLMAACGDVAGTDRFVGEWVNKAPEAAGERKFGLTIPEGQNEFTIKSAGESKIELTRSVMGRERSFVYEVEKDSVLSGSRVIYTLEGGVLQNNSTGAKYTREQ